MEEANTTPEQLRVRQLLGSDAIRIIKPEINAGAQTEEEPDNFFEVRKTRSGAPIIDAELNQAVRDFYSQTPEGDTGYFFYQDSGNYSDSGDEFKYSVVAVRSAEVTDEFDYLFIDETYLNNEAANKGYNEALVELVKRNGIGHDYRTSCALVSTTCGTLETLGKYRLQGRMGELADTDTDITTIPESANAKLWVISNLAMILASRVPNADELTARTSSSKVSPEVSSLAIEQLITSDPVLAEYIIRIKAAGYASGWAGLLDDFDARVNTTFASYQPKYVSPQDLAKETEEQRLQREHSFKRVKNLENALIDSNQSGRYAIIQLMMDVADTLDFKFDSHDPNIANLEGFNQKVVALKGHIESLRSLYVRHDEYRRVREKTSPIELGSIDISALIDDVKFFDLNGLVNGSDLQVTSSGDITAVFTESDSVAMIVKEVMKNAFESRKPNQADHKVQIHLVNSGNGITIEIDDNGKGIPEARIPLMFYPGSQVDNVRSPIRSGMGLAIASEAARIIGADIQMSLSELGGVKVTIFIPNHE